MAATRFLDTNVLLYAISRAEDEVEKAERARSLLTFDDWVLSVQVLQEFYVQATRYTKPDRIQHDQAVTLIEAWLRFRVQEITIPILQAALNTSRQNQISYWDAAIIEAARAAGCFEVYTEDLASGRDYNGVRVVNPFL
ncbi:MAG: PIN domain-containing protein [Caldilineaceae bacterium]|nr:PIN domain-containing protein [Caldilineaceae bacterium]